MNWKISSATSAFACLLFAGLNVFAQSNPPKPVVYTTPSKLAVAQIKSVESGVHDVRGKAAFTVTAANGDDTVAGTLIYTIPADARQKIARIAGKPLDSIPTSVTKKDVIAGFQSDTACPVIHLEIGAMELDVAGAKLQFNRVTLDIVETSGAVPQHFCAWTRQINAKRQRRGIIASLNRLINVEQ